MYTDESLRLTPSDLEVRECPYFGKTTSTTDNNLFLGETDPHDRGSGMYHMLANGRAALDLPISQNEGRDNRYHNERTS